MTAVFEKFCAHGNEIQAAFDVSEAGFLRCFNELVNPGDEALPGCVGDQNLVTHLENRAFACGNLHG